jgi:photosystem II stability/assembly factor-like uncharacterized protein
MKKVITKFWGVAIILVMLASLGIMGAAPAAALTPLAWNLDISVPGYTPNSTWTEYPGSDIMDFAVSPDGMTIYAALHETVAPPGGAHANPNAVLFKSTDGGAHWTDLTSPANNRLTHTNIASTDFVAMSPDNPNVVVVLDATVGAINAAASTDGGNNFYDMGTIQGATGGTTAIGAAYDLDVSAQYQNGIYYVAIAGADTAVTPLPAIYYYNFGAAVGSWRDAVTDWFAASTVVTPPGKTPPWLAGTAIDNFMAIRFSPNFASDSTLMALSEQIGNGVDDGVVRLHTLDMTSHIWDTDRAIPNYPVAVDTATVADYPGGSMVAAGSIGLGPDFIGSEEESVISFVGVAMTAIDGVPVAHEVGGLFRVDESQTVYNIRENTDIYSVDYDGNTVVAGDYWSNNVFRVTDPLSGSPTAASARSLKRIGVDQIVGTPDTYADSVIVHWAGEVVFGSKMGSASALSKSTDMGNTWNDFTLMDSANTNFDDIYTVPDGSVKYVAANDGGEASVYRIAGMSAKRVLCVSQTAGSPAFSLRGLASDPDVIYAFDNTGSDIYQTADGGVSRWSKKTTYPGGAIADLAVQSATTIYAATGALVYKSTNNGSGWGDGVDTLIPAGIFSLKSIGEGQIVAGGAAQYVAWSTDGGATWTKNGPPIPGANFMVDASGLTSNDFIFAVPFGGNQAYRANPAPVGTEFKSMNFGGWPTITAGTAAMLYTNGILYLVGSEAVGTPGLYLTHTLAPTKPGAHTAALWGTGNIDNIHWLLAPIAAASTGSIRIYSPLGAAAPPTGVFYYEDIVSLPSTAPVLHTPTEGQLFKIVSSMLADSELVNFTWDRAAPQITSYNLWVALDKDFTQPVPVSVGGAAAAYPANVPSVAPSDIVAAIATRGSFQPGETYYWRVSAATPFSGAFSETRSFIIAPSIATVPDLLTPPNGATTTSVSPAFSWSAVTGTTKYDFQLSELPGMETTVFTDQTTDAGEALPVTITLDVGKTYFWRVRAAEPVLGDWSTVGNFMVVAPPSSAPPPVTITSVPAPTITMPPQPAPTTITISPPPPAAQIAPAYIWAIIIIGAILVIAVIVLIVRTRRSV